MSEIKVNKLSPRTNCGTVQLGDSGDTITIPAGATITNNGTAAGFGATGAASWDTTVKTSGFTAVSGVGYFVNTTAGAITVTLPASPSAGDVVAVSDYAGTADTNNITIARNGSNINGAAADLIVNKENSAVTLVYVDGTQGWKATDTSSINDIYLEPTYVTATGGTVTCCGDYKIHTFTGPGTFTVTSVGNAAGSTSVDYLVVAGGGSGGKGAFAASAGGGAGGLRFSACTYCNSSPLKGNALPVSVQGYSITVGAGGTGITSPAAKGNNGSDSIFSTITSTGGGGAGSHGNTIGASGGSGGGSSCVGSTPTGRSGGAGNTPPVSPSQGNNGGAIIGAESPNYVGGGGGGAGAAGDNANNAGGNAPGNGGNGLQVNIDTNNYYWAGGGASPAWIDGPNAGNGGLGGGGGGTVPSAAPGIAGTGGGSALNSGGNGTKGAAGGSGGANTGGGGAGSNNCTSPVVSGAGGSGIVIIRYKFQ